MASQGPLSPTTVVNDATTGTIAWSNPGNAVASDDARATSLAILGSEETQYLMASGWGFTIPAGSTINGIKIEVERSALLLATDIRDVEAVAFQTNIAGIGTNLAASTNFPTTDAYQTFGGISELHGLPWTVDQINEAVEPWGFAFRSVFFAIDTARVDHIRVTVYYTEITYVAASSASVNATGRIVSVVFTAVASWVALVDEAHSPISISTPHGTLTGNYLDLALSNGNLTLTVRYELSAGQHIFRGENPVIADIAQGEFDGTTTLKSDHVVNLSPTNGSEAVSKLERGSGYMGANHFGLVTPPSSSSW